MWRFACAIAVIAISVILPLHADAQELDAAREQGIDGLMESFPGPLTPEQVDAILDIADPEILRSALRERLLNEIATDPQSVEIAIDDNPLSFYGNHLQAMHETWGQLGASLSSAFAQPQGIYPAVRVGTLFFSVFMLLAVGLAATVAVGALLAPVRRAAQIKPAGASRIGTFALLVLLDACQVAAFFGGALIYYAILDPQHPLAPALLSIMLYAALAALVVERLFSLFCALMPPSPEPTEDRRNPARRMYWTAVVTTILLVLIGAAGRTLALVGVPNTTIVALLVPISILPFAFLIANAWVRRGQVRAALERSLGVRYGVALAVVPIIGTIYLVGVWLLVVDALFREQDQIGVRALASLILAMLGPLLTFSLSGFIARYYRGGVETEGGSDVGPQVMRIMAAVWIVLAFLIVYGTALIWGIDLKTYLGIGSAAVAALFNVAIVILLGFVAWSLIVNAIDRAMRRAGTDGNVPRAQRMKTLLPLLQRFLQIVLFAIVVMVLLSSMGIEIGPLLAGAGVVGIAIGLGAQQTIADILAGVFFLLEDSFRIGDYVEVGNIRGNVEGISMRSLKLRHHRGAVHTLPFGQMKSLTNYTRDWALMRLEFSVAPNTDISLVKRIIKEIAGELKDDPELGPNFIEPLKSQGIRSVADGAVVIGVKFIAKPNEQFVIRREAYQRIINAFNANGITLVGRSVVVKVETDDRVSPQVAAAAASTVSPGPND